MGMVKTELFDAGLDPVEGNLVTLVYNTYDGKVMTVYDTPTSSSSSSSSTSVSLASSAASPLVTQYNNTLARDWAAVVLIESILDDAKLYILPGDNAALTTVWDSYQNYLTSINYHPGYMFLLDDTQKATLNAYYNTMYNLFDTDFFNHIRTLFDVKYSEIDSFTIPQTQPSGYPTAFNDSMISPYYSLALASVVYADMSISFETKYKAVLNTNNNTNLMRSAFDAYTSFHNQQFDENPVSIWSVFDEFISELPWEPH
ncbi:unnamed protein product [Ambrosiozyma monospora]|uniref:Unnamed protein product n=1 Tax=Ambrosiozyma monospora TaxID=43982 RepID=A0ACB5T7M0_AMBMO|nr:unnamed protein product [Ambrosiozyma monospora]